jgi:hypothetical protein
MQRYELTLKNEKTKTYTTISWLIIALNFFLFAYLSIGVAKEKLDYTFFIATAAAALCLVAVAFRSRLPKWLNISFCFVIIIISWIILQFYWAAIVNLVLFFFQFITKRKLIVLMFEDRIIYPSFPKNEIHWQNLNNLMLKDGLLTIDYKNNKLIQQETEETDQIVDEAEFNDFCRRQLNKEAS